METHFVHPTAVVEDEATIGNGTRIWHFSHVMAYANIGAHCTLGQNVFVARDVWIGDRVKIQNNVSLYTGVIVEDDVFLGPSMVFTNVINPRSAFERKDEFQKTVVRKGATVGANATILCGIELGQFSFVGAGAVVTKSVSPYQLVTGNPARPTGWMSEMGYALKFDDAGLATCPGDGGTYRLEEGQVIKESS